MSTTTRKAPKTSASTKSKKAATTGSKARTTPSKKNEAAARSAPPSSVPGTAPAAAPTVVAAPKPVVVGPMMRKKELVDLVVSQSGQKKKVVKPVVETMLAVLGDALGDNRELNLPPLGRIRVRREKALPNGRVVVAKIRQRAPQPDKSSEGSGT